MPMTTPIRSDEIVTYSGRLVRPLTPDPATIELEDIAHALANQCRFTGHTKEFYSVAQHSVLVSQICDWDDALWGLLHDASEAYLSDIARPVKKQDSFGGVYRTAETRLMRAIAFHFGLPSSWSHLDGFHLPESVKWADDVLFRTEARDLMPPRFREEHPEAQGEVLDYEIIPWAPDVAEIKFLQRYQEIIDG